MRQSYNVISSQYQDGDCFHLITLLAEHQQ